jgi:hypothetical protein
MADEQTCEVHCCVVSHSCINVKQGYCCVFGCSCANVSEEQVMGGNVIWMNFGVVFMPLGVLKNCTR